LPRRGVKSQISGKVLEVGWAPTESGKSIQNYALVKVRLGLYLGLEEETRQRAEVELDRFRGQLLGKTVVMYAQP